MRASARAHGRYHTRRWYASEPSTCARRSLERLRVRAHFRRRRRQPARRPPSAA
jgi:hypothetical protein